MSKESRPRASRASSITGAGYRLPSEPSIVNSLREALVDFYFNSWRLVPANVIWGVLFVLVAFAALVWWPLIILAGLLGPPVAGIYRLAAVIERGEPAGFGVFLSGMRRFAVQASALGFAATFAALIFTANIFIGLASGGIVGGVFTLLAAYADLGLAMFLVVAWPILVDPVRDTMSFGARLRVAFYVLATRAGRVLGLTIVVIAVLLVSAALFVALVTLSVAYVSLVATRYVLAAADRLEGRATVALPDPGP